MKQLSNQAVPDTKSFKVFEIERNQGKVVHLHNNRDATTPILKGSRIGIIGGGIMGLVLAYRLSKLGARIDVYEKDTQPGGLSTYKNYGKFFWDKFYHVIVPSDGSLIGLIEELGLGDQLNWRRAYTGYYVYKKFYPLNNAWDFLLFPLLNIWDKFRLVYTLLYGSRINNWRKLEKYTVKAWLVRMGGLKNFNRFWAPLLLAKLGENYKKVSGVFIWTYIRRMFKKHEYPVKKDHLGYVSGGYKTVFNRLVNLLEENGSKLHLGVDVSEIAPVENGKIKINYGRTTEEYDKVVFTAPLNVLERVTTTEVVRVVKKEQPIEYMGVICLVVTSKRAICPYYQLNIGDMDTPFTGVIGMSSLVDLEETAGEYLTYFPKYIPADHPHWSKSDSELTELFLRGVFDMYPDINRDDILNAYLHRAYKVQPLQLLNYSELIPEIKSNHQNFFVLNTSQFVNDSVNNNSVVRHVNNFVKQFQKELVRK